MGNQYETLIPSKLKYFSLTFHKTNNTKLRLTIALNTSIHDDILDYLCVDIEYSFVVKK